MPATAERSSADAEDLTRGGMAAVCACFALALVAAGMALPLSWLPGQLAVLCLVLVLLPGSVILAGGRLAGMVGLAAADFALRVAVTRWVTVGLLVVALPLYQTHVTARAADAQNPWFSIGFSAALCLLVGNVADALARAWATLQVQEWEVADAEPAHASAVSLETAGRVNRGAVLRDLWCGWMAGEMTLAAAFLLSAQLSHGHQVATTLGLLAFVGYTLVGLLLLSQAARARQMVQWRLSGVDVPKELAGAWNGAGLRVAALAMFGFGLFLLLRGLDVAHATVQWTADTVLLPILNPLLDRLRHMGTGFANSCTGTSSCGGSPAPRSLPVAPRAPAANQGPATKIDFSWLQHWWPAAVAGLVAALVILTFLRTRGDASSRGIWREMIALLYRDLRLLLRLLARPTKRVLSQIANRGREAIAKRPSLARRRGPTQGTTTRQAIIGLYLTALRFAARRGMPRRPGRTPREYADELATLLPAGSDSFNKMTDLFVSVRYTQAPVAEDRESAMRALWTAFRAMLSQARR